MSEMETIFNMVSLQIKLCGAFPGQHQAMYSVITRMWFWTPPYHLVHWRRNIMPLPITG